MSLFGNSMNELTPLRSPSTPRRSSYSPNQSRFGSVRSMSVSSSSDNEQAEDSELLNGESERHLPLPTGRESESVDDIEIVRDAKDGFDADSLDYDTIYNTIYQNELRAMTVSQFRQQNYFRWLIIFMIGIATGVVAFLLDGLTEQLSKAKIELTVHLLAQCDGCFLVPFAAWTGLAAGLVVIAAILVAFLEPVAGGSGIPEIKCYLNGVKIPRVVRLNTLLTKTVGTICGVASGLPIGKEGPMIHSGAILAAGISQGSSTTANFETPFFRDFRNDTAKRDFVAGGAAAGIAAAFGAPIGGVLFAIEEGASFWDQGLTWRTFLCSMTSTFTVNFLVTGSFFNLWGEMSYPGLLNLGSFDGLDAGWFAQQVPLFILIGIGGGLIGAAWIHLSTLMLLFRRRWIPVSQRTLRVIDALLIAVLVASVEYLSPFFLSICSPFDVNTNEFSLPQMGCPAGTYNELASLFFTGQENAIRNLYHTQFNYSYPSLIIFAVFYFILMFLTFGIAIPGGIFIPSILLGATYGRIVGQGFHSFWPASITPSLAALLGSSAVLGGIHRMTLSLTVLMIEASGDMTYAIPIMIALWSAKLIGDFINPGIYDVQMNLKRLPLLDWEPPLAFRKFHARDVMNSPVRSFKHIESVRQIVIMLRQTTHNGYPVVDKRGHYAGLILRSQLISLLKLKLFCPMEEMPFFYAQTPITTHSFLADYPRYPDIDTVSLSPEELDQYINLSFFFNPVAFTIRRSCPLMRVFRLVRTMGLRHLPVVDSLNRPVGMITRHDLVNLEDRSALNPHPWSDDVDPDSQSVQSPVIEQRSIYQSEYQRL